MIEDNVGGKNGKGFEALITCDKKPLKQFSSNMKLFPKQCQPVMWKIDVKQEEHLRCSKIAKENTEASHEQVMVLTSSKAAQGKVRAGNPECTLITIQH